MRSCFNTFIAASLAASASAFFQADLMAEYMWCCQDAICLEACLKLCMGGEHGAGKQEFCLPDGSAHPLVNPGGHGAPLPPGFEDQGSGGTLPEGSGGSLPQGSGGTLPTGTRRELFKLMPDPLCGDEPDLTAPEHSAWVICAYCGPEPTSQTHPTADDATLSVLHTEYLTCFFDFFSGNGYSKQYCERTLEIRCCVDAGCGGEPHFKTWNDVWYDYHGECDLNFIHAPSFAHHMGLDIHVRTKIRDHYSFIESVAIKIGNDVAEISGFGSYMLNGVDSADLDEDFSQLGAFKFTHDQQSKKVHNFTIDAGDHKILVKTMKDFVSVTLDHANVGDYIDSVGMLGRFGTGTLLGRDGKTRFTHENINEFGQEWQVLPHEPRLFDNTDRAPQHPAKCRLPDPAVREGRRLSEGGVSEKEAEEACAGWQPGYKDKCIYDVMATGDLELAEAGAY